MSLFIIDAMIYAESQKVHGFIQVDDGKITTIGSMDELPSLSNHEVIRLTPQYQIVPGMIDVHIHGVNGVDVMDATPKAIQTMAKTLPREGTTSFLATTITQSEEKIEQALANVANYMKHPSHGAASCLGIHLEGPFISDKRAGAQPHQYILPPDIDLFRKWQKIADGNIRLVTIAPEEKHGFEFTKYLSDTGVIVSIGHSDATYQQVVQAIRHGVSHVTHLFNGMTGIHHRDPGVAGAALLRKELMVELIADGIHVCPEMIAFTYDQVTSERLILITDSMRAKCLKKGRYELGGQEVEVSGLEARLVDGTLAGSILKMKDAWKMMKECTGASIHQCIQMTSQNAAKELGIDRQKGSIAVGKDADLVVFNSECDIELTICQGIIAYERGIADGNRESKRL